MWDEKEAGAPAPAATEIEVQDVKLFGKWNPDEVQVSDISLTVSLVCFEKIDYFTVKCCFQMFTIASHTPHYLQWRSAMDRFLV